MFKNQPIGLYVLALANTGERFGYFTVVSVLLYYLQSKFGLGDVFAGQVIGIFMAFVYLMPLLGGWIADRWSFSKCVSLGMVIMGLGYFVVAWPTEMRTSQAVVLLISGMVLVGLGTGLFKSNLQVMIGDLYNNPRYSDQRDAGFSIFYMAINVGAMFAPAMATYVNGLALGAEGFVYNGQLADLCNAFMAGNSQAGADAVAMAQSLGIAATDASAFCTQYVSALATGYSYSFGVAFLSVVVSYIIYYLGRSTYRQVVDVKGDKSADNPNSAPVVELTPEQTRSRITALFLVFGVVIFFWMVFMQNSVTLSRFAQTCTTPYPGGFTRIGFNIWALLIIIAGVYGGFSLFQSKTTLGKCISGAVLLGAILSIWLIYSATPDPLQNVQPQDYQQFNGFFIVALTPFSLAFFAWLASKKKEPSAPRKIGYGMIMAALAYVVMMVGSFGLNGTTGNVSSNWLISTYLLLTIAELLLSPMGISFVSKVAPPKYKGSMMGCWFVSTAIGNYLISIPMLLWGKIPVWTLWLILIGLCLLSAGFIFAIMKKLEAATADAPQQIEPVEADGI